MQNGKCAYCEKDITLQKIVWPPKDRAQLDHKKPRIKGGRDNLENLHLTCAYCNSDKADMNHQDYLKIKGTQQILFDTAEYLRPKKPSHRRRKASPA